MHRLWLAGLLFVAVLAGVVEVGAVRAQELLFAPAPGSPITVKGGPGNVLMGDVNKDDKLDLLVASGQASTLTILLGQGDGQFRAAPNSPMLLPDHPGEMAVGDINGDGILDMAISSHDTYMVMILFGDGKGSFVFAPTSPAVMKEGSEPHTHGLRLGDLNGDGKLDLVTANSDDNDVAVALGDGKGGFTPVPGSPFSVEPDPYPLTLGDLNGDGHLDIVSTSTVQSSRKLTLLLNDGKAGFQRSAAFIRTPSPWFVAIGDVNGDSKPDIISTHASERSELTVLLGDGTGQFTEVTESPFELGHGAWQIAFADVNNDNKGDVIAASRDKVRVMLGDGQGRFAPAPGSPYPSGKGTWRLALGDLNGDGKLDIATSNLESDSVTILLAR